MQRMNFDREWKFAEGAGSIYSLMIPNDNVVNLPHDFTIGTDVTPEAPGGRESGFYKYGIANYTKMVYIPEEWKDQRILLEFDGSYMNTEVNVGGNMVSIHPYGYSPFHADITPYVQYGKENRVNVIVNNSAPETGRWYSGSGIYRHVDLLRAPKIHLAPWSIFAYTERIVDDTAHIIVEITVENHTDTEVKERVTLSLSEEGTEHTVSAGHAYVTVPAKGVQTGRVAMMVKGVKVWDVESPALYYIKAELGKDHVTDTDLTLFGIRTISIDRENGFCLNGRSLKLKGGCIHHDNGMLGAVSLYDSEYRKLKLHKTHGFNAVRCAHNPPSRDMLEACDRLGILVFNEAFDVWKMQKNPNDYHLYFDACWKKDMTAFMKRDRNHPSIIAWSTGNEIVERHGLGEGHKLAQELAAYARSLDHTRFITNSIPVPFNGMNDEDMMEVFKGWMELAKQETVQNLATHYSEEILPVRTEQFAAPLDVVGYNYMEHRYEKDGDIFPNRIICGTESFPFNIDRVWEEVEKHPYVIGDFTWTSYDHIGEAGIGITTYSEEEFKGNPLQGPPVLYPFRLSYCADFDLCGFDRAQLHFRKIVWGSDETYVHVHNPHNFDKKEYKGRWSWSEGFNAWSFAGCEGMKTNIDVYSAAEEVEILINGRSQGRKPSGKEQRFSTRFEVVYDPGEMIAISYAGGKEVSRQELFTVGAPEDVILTVEKECIKADGNSLAYVLVEIVDGNGNRVPYGKDYKAKAEVSGAATLAAFGNGRPITEENYTTGEFTSYEGRYQAIVRAGYEMGEAKLKVVVEGLGEVEAIISVE